MEIRASKADILVRILCYGTPPTALIFAIYLQLSRHLTPCDLCIQQRIPYFVALIIILLAVLVHKIRRTKIDLILLSCCLIWSGSVAIYHVAAEKHIIIENKPCGALIESGSDTLTRIIAAPMVRCDEPQWLFLGISMAGWNAIVALSTGFFSLVYLADRLARRAQFLSHR